MNFKTCERNNEKERTCTEKRLGRDKQLPTGVRYKLLMPFLQYAALPGLLKFCTTQQAVSAEIDQNSRRPVLKI